MNWRDIEGFEGIYMISEDGLIMSMPRKGSHSFPKLLKYQLTKGYYSCKLSKEGLAKRYTIHRLVAKAFLKDTYFDGADVNHKNCVKTDNNVSNLEWLSKSDNTQHAWNNGRCKPNRYWLNRFGEDNATSKPISQYTLDMVFIAHYPSATIASKQTNINRQKISSCCTGYRHTAGGYKWRYKV